MCDTPRGAELGELCTHILRAIVEVEYFRIPCSENISLSSEMTLTTLLWPDGRHWMRIIFE